MVDQIEDAGALRHNLCIEDVCRDANCQCTKEILRIMAAGRAQAEAADLIKASRELLDSVSFDENGALIGGHWVGGHGGMISSETHKKADELRRVLSRFDDKKDSRNET